MDVDGTVWEWCGDTPTQWAVPSPTARSATGLHQADELSRPFWQDKAYENAPTRGVGPQNNGHATISLLATATQDTRVLRRSDLDSRCPIATRPARTGYQ
jgi:formylglycine-generating enzyme required for sulfatase activity